MSTVFNDTTDKLGLIQECETKVFGGNYGAISGNTKRLKTFTRYLNNAMNRWTALVIQYDTRWQFHDANFTTQPEAYTTMTAGQQDYGLSDLHLQLRHVYVKNSNGEKVPLIPLDERDLAKRGIAYTEFLTTNGMPKYYDVKGRSILLFPAPSAEETTLTDGLFVTYTSAPSYFADDDTTKEAGIPLIFSNYPAIFASRAYCLDNKMRSKARDFTVELAEMEDDIREFYSMRNRDDRPRVTVRKRNYQ